MGKIRVLLVGSSVPPYLPADAQRIRHLCHALPEKKIDFELLVPGKEFQNPEWFDPQGIRLFPKNIPIHVAQPFRTDLFLKVGVRGMNWRALIPMFQTGCALLQSGRFDLIYISTTKFNFFCLGRLWKEKYGIPYILDFHDPWFREGPMVHTTANHWKAAIGYRLAKYLEKYAVSKADGLVSVSPNYLEQLKKRTPDSPAFQKGCTKVIPFSFAERDFDLPISPKPIKRKKRIIYVGVGAELMARSFGSFLSILEKVQKENVKTLQGLTVHLFGTDGRWKPGRPKILQQLAEEKGLGGLVEENPKIIPYSKSLALMRNADGLLVLGVDDPAYMPSKLFSYSFSGNPLLAILTKDSQAQKYFKKTPEIGLLALFGREGIHPKCAIKIRRFIKDVKNGRKKKRPKVQEIFSSDKMGEQHVEIFKKCLSGFKQ